MAKVSLGEWGAEITPQDVEYLATWFTRSRNRYLNYSTSFVKRAYSQSALNLLAIEGRGGVVHAPYELVYDFRDGLGGRGWGTVEVSGDYSFPGELAEHRDAMVKRFKRQGRLKKRNNLCPRVRGISIGKKGKPTFSLERAWYYQQVGSNLTLDYDGRATFPHDFGSELSVRSWDPGQAGLPARTLPTLAQSKLANTIGIAVGISAKTKNGITVWLRRKRSNRVAVYPGMQHVPLSFALSPQALPDGKTTLRELIRFDMGAEYAEEMGLEPGDLSEVRPLAFCRDLVRGGKPQFFFSAEAKIPFEELRRRMKDGTGEYTRSKPKRIARRPKGMRGYSPELIAFAMLSFGGFALLSR